MRRVAERPRKYVLFRAGDPGVRPATAPSVRLVGDGFVDRDDRADVGARYPARHDRRDPLLQESSSLGAAVLVRVPLAPRPAAVRVSVG
eukprot:SAG31_NODE_214_length_20084_cov_2.644684_2_plen_89_part_00